MASEDLIYIERLKSNRSRLCIKSCEEKHQECDSLQDAVLDQKYFFSCPCCTVDMKRLTVVMSVS